MVHSEMVARNDQHALFDAQARDQLRRIDRHVIARVHDRSSVRRRVREQRSVIVQPLRDDRKVPVQDGARAGEDAFAMRRRQRAPGHQVAERAGRDRDVVVVRPGRGDERRRSDDPSDPKAGQSVRLRQPTRDDHAIRASPHRRCFASITFRPAVDLVGQDPCTVSVGDRRDAIEIGRVDARSRWIVRIAEDDQLRARRHQSRERAGVHPPALLLQLERPFLHDAAERADEPPRLHVVRHHHHDFVARLDEMPRRDVVRLGAAVGHLHVVRGCIRIQRRDRRAERNRPVRLCIPKAFGEQRRARFGVVEELVHAQRVHAAFGQVEVHLVLERGLHAFHREGIESHDGQL